MYLKKVTLAVIIGIIVSFSIRTLGTLSPQIFKNAYIVKATILVNTFFIFFHFLFWIFFYKEYASSKKTILKKACILSIAGSLAVSLLYIKRLPFVFDIKVTFPLLLMSPYIEVFVPLAGSVLHLIFFIVFRSSIDREEKKVLNKPILSIIAGISFFICFHVTVLFNFLTTNKFAWLEKMPKLLSVGTLPILLIAALLILTFYYKFYFFLDSHYNREGSRG